MNDQTLKQLIEMLTDRERMVFAHDCAEHVLHFFEEEFPDDNRPRHAIEVAKKYAQGDAEFAAIEVASEVAYASSIEAGAKGSIHAHQAAFASALLGHFPSSFDIALTVATAASAAAGGTHASNMVTNSARQAEEAWQEHHAKEILSRR